MYVKKYLYDIYKQFVEISCQLWYLVTQYVKEIIMCFRFHVASDINIVFILHCGKSVIFVWITFEQLVST